MKRLLLTVLLSIVLILCACSTSTVITVSADQLYTEYYLDELEAHTKYYGKNICVNGEISEFGTDYLGNPCIYLIAQFDRAYDEEDEMEGEIILVPYITIMCRFEEEHQSELVNIIQGESVSIKGTCRSYAKNLLGEPVHIMIENCQVNDE